MLRPYCPANSYPATRRELVAGVLVELRVRASLRLRNRHQREMRVPRRLELPGVYVLAKADEIRAPLRFERELIETLGQNRVQRDCGQRIAARERARAHRPHERQRAGATRRRRRGAGESAHGHETVK